MAYCMDRSVLRNSKLCQLREEVNYFHPPPYIGLEVILQACKRVGHLPGENRRSQDGVYNGFGEFQVRIWR